MAQVVIRRAERNDYRAISALVRADESALEARYGELDIESLIDTAYLSVVAIDETGSVVAFAVFNDYPRDNRAGAWLQWVRHAYGVLDYTVRWRRVSHASPRAR